MKKIIFSILVIGILTSCGHAVIEGNPVVEQININTGTEGHKYTVKLITKNGDDDAYMSTDFRYQVGDTLISLYENFETRMKPTQDSLFVYKELVKTLQKENESLKTYQQFLQSKIPNSEIK